MITWIESTAICQLQNERDTARDASWLEVYCLTYKYTVLVYMSKLIKII